MSVLKMQEQIRLALGSDPRCVMWRNNSGAYDSAAMNARDLKQVLTLLTSGNVTAAVSKISAHLFNSGSRWVRYGVGKGGSDLLGMNRKGRFLAMEVKDGTDRLSPEQTLFLELVNGMGGLAREVRSPEQALEALKESMK